MTTSNVVRLSTSDVPKRDRFAYWREVVCAKIWTMDVQSRAMDNFNCSMLASRVGEVDLIRLRGVDATFTRTPKHIRDAPDSVMAVIAKSGAFRFSHRTGSATFSPGGGVFRGSFEPTVAAAVGDPRRTYESVNVVLPGHLVHAMVRDRDRAGVGTFGLDDPAGRLMIGYVDLVMRDPPPDQATALMVGRHITDLFLAATQTVRDGAEVELQRGRRAARLRLAMAYVLHHLGDADLTAACVGRHLAISTRALQMHFEFAGMTFSGFLLEQRLLRVLRDLRDARCDAKTVAEIAFAAGFHDISHFNRCFRRRFGDTPSGVRSAAR